MTEILIAFVFGMGTAYLLIRPQIVSLETFNKELRGCLYERVGYKPWKDEKPSEGTEPLKKPVSEFVDLLEEQRKARESD